jgi:hypothetical protein
MGRIAQAPGIIPLGPNNSDGGISQGAKRTIAALVSGRRCIVFQCMRLRNLSACVIRSVWEWRLEAAFASP